MDEPVASTPAQPRKTAPAGTPVRGTQTFVGVMSAVWGRPSLTALEVLWRWSPGILLLAFYLLFGRHDRAFGMATLPAPQLSTDLAAVQAISVFQPVAAVHSLTAAWHDLSPPAWPLVRWLLPLAFVVWNVIAAFGRTLVLRRLEPALRPRRATTLLLGMLRSALLLGVWWLWFDLVIASARIAILDPAAQQQEPSVVLFAAMLICGTLLLYVAWAIVSWSLYLAPLLAMRLHIGAIGSLGAARRSSRVRGKLIEVNLVMNIEKLALIVLAMVASATPLPFSTVASQGFLNLWWTGVMLVYFVVSDYFHVVRSAAYLALDASFEDSRSARRDPASTSRVGQP